MDQSDFPGSNNVRIAQLLIAMGRDPLSLPGAVGGRDAIGLTLEIPQFSSYLEHQDRLQKLHDMALGIGSRMDELTPAAKMMRDHIASLSDPTKYLPESLGDAIGKWRPFLEDIPGSMGIAPQMGIFSEAQARIDKMLKSFEGIGSEIHKFDDLFEAEIRRVSQSSIWPHPSARMFDDLSAGLSFLPGANGWTAISPDVIGQALLFDLATGVNESVTDGKVDETALVQTISRFLSGIFGHLRSADGTINYGMVGFVFDAIGLVLMLITLLNNPNKELERKVGELTEVANDALTTLRDNEPILYRTTDDVHLRLRASVDSQSLRILSPGMTVEFRGQEGEWILVCVAMPDSGAPLTGYVFAQYLEALPTNQ